MKMPLLALAAGLAMLSSFPAASVSPVEARTAERATMNRLDPQRITSRRVQRNDYAGRRYNWRAGENRRYRQYGGWNRYNSRPNRWRNRGCVSVGPIWFCP
ncbi:MAG: hypothetical protein ABL893_09580 [Hyphomicrobium sp.]|nr:hypothetical protein [Hyphomicrobium sp.]